MLMRRRGRPLLRAAATTAVVAGTAGAVRHRQDQRYAAQASAQDAEQQAQYEAAYRQAAADQAAAPQAAPAAPASGATSGLNQELQQLAELHTSGILTDEEFAAAKAQVLKKGLG
jgi:putative oligomerization/nucleic acid binding protein